MRTSGGLFERLCDPDIFEGLARRTIRGKRRRPDVAWLLFRWEDELERLRAAVATETWRPAGFELIPIRDPKPRLIARAPIGDRIVHGAVAQLLEAPLLRSATEDDFACREGYGAHRAALRLLEHMRRRRYFLHLDIKACFFSIDPGLVSALLARKVRDRRLLVLVDRILNAGAGLLDAPEVREAAGLAPLPGWPPAGRGLPIGAATSQLFAAHLFLAGLDHFARRELHLPSYLRYVDDIFCFADRRGDLGSARDAIARWLERERDLRRSTPTPACALAPARFTPSDSRSAGARSARGRGPFDASAPGLAPSWSGAPDAPTSPTSRRRTRASSCSARRSKRPILAARPRAPLRRPRMAANRPKVAGEGPPMAEARKMAAERHTLNDQ